MWGSTRQCRSTRGLHPTRSAFTHGGSHHGWTHHRHGCERRAGVPSARTSQHRMLGSCRATLVPNPNPTPAHTPFPKPNRNVRTWLAPTRLSSEPCVPSRMGADPNRREDAARGSETSRDSAGATRQTAHPEPNRLRTPLPCTPPPTGRTFVTPTLRTTHRPPPNRMLRHPGQHPSRLRPSGRRDHPRLPGRRRCIDPPL